MNRFIRTVFVGGIALLLSVSFGIAGTSVAKKESKVITSKEKAEADNAPQSHKVTTSKKVLPNEQKRKIGAVDVKTKDETKNDPIQQIFRTGEEINWQVLSNGGGFSTTTGLQLFGVIGQTASGESVSGAMRLQHGFLQSFGSQSCCIGSTGNIDCDPSDITDITDLTVLIDHLFLSLDPLCCRVAGNIDGDNQSIVDITDLTFLIDHLFISLIATSACQ